MLDLLEPEVAEADEAAVFLDDVYEIKSALSCVKQSINCKPGHCSCSEKLSGLHRTFSLGSCPELSLTLSFTLHSF